MLERVWRRRVDPSQIVTPDLASFLCECSRETGRQVGILVDRKGNIDHVIVGDQNKIELPDLGPRRAGIGRMRGVRLVHTHLRGEPLTRDDYIDLAKLRLDLVGAILMTQDGGLGPLTCAHLLPPNPQNEQWRTLEPISAHELQRFRAPDFLELIGALEDEFAEHARTARVVDDGKDRAVLVQVNIGRITPEEADARLRDSEARYRDLSRRLEVILEGITAGITVQDRTGRIVFANTAAVPGRYVLTVRVTGNGESDVETSLTLTVTAP